VQPVEWSVSWSMFNGGAGWAARITGPDEQYGLARQFLRAIGRETSRSGQTGTNAYLIDAPGVYQVHGRRAESGFRHVHDDGTWHPVEDAYHKPDPAAALALSAPGARCDHGGG